MTLHTLAPPDRSLTPESLTRARELLRSELAAQMTQASEARQTIRELTGQADSDSLLEREIAEGVVARAAEATDAIKAALERLDAGRYGTCERCGDPISSERLDAIPHTPVCVRCPQGARGLFG